MRNTNASILLTVFCLFACKNSTPQELIIGTWKIDSTYTYYNGFDFTQRVADGNWATYVYEKDGMMKEIKKGYLQQYFFELPAEDTLVVTSVKGGQHATFNILYLNQGQLVLKKSKDPVFGGGGKQERYEIRYFSKIPTLSDSLKLFSDPRKE